MSGPAINTMLGIQAIAMGEAGCTPTEIAQVLPLHRTTIGQILEGHGRWGEVAENPIAIELRRDQQRHLEVAYRAAAAKSLSSAVEDEKIAKASTYQLAIASKIFLESSRLLAGESTANVSVQAKVDVTGLDALASALGQALIKVDDVTP